MKKLNKNVKNTFNNFFKISDKSYSHINILMDNDIEAFIDPYHIANNRFQNDIAKEMYHRSKSFLEKLNRDYIIPQKRKAGIQFLSNLKEDNSYKLGYSVNNKGKGIGAIKAETIFNALSYNKFVQQGITITNEAHNVLLLVEGIGQDNMSDTLANVCRDILADYTLKQCQKYGITSLSKFKIKFYNSITQKWETKKVLLPTYKGEKIILVPNFLTSKSRVYPNHYNWFMSKEYISKEILKGNINVAERDKFVTKLKDGSEKCIIKEVNKNYKKKKGKLIEFETQYNGSLSEFQEYAKNHYLPVNNNDLIALHDKAS